MHTHYSTVVAPKHVTSAVKYDYHLTMDTS